MEKGDKGSTLTRMGESGWRNMFLLVPAYLGCPWQTTVKWLLLLLFYHFLSIHCIAPCGTQSCVSYKMTTVAVFFLWVLILCNFVLCSPFWIYYCICLYLLFVVLGLISVVACKVIGWKEMICIFVSYSNHVIDMHRVKRPIKWFSLQSFKVISSVLKFERYVKG